MIEAPSNFCYLLIIYLIGLDLCGDIWGTRRAEQGDVSLPAICVFACIISVALRYWLC